MINGRHDSRCPNYTPPKARHYCSICSDGILDGEDYVVNYEGDYVHYDCLSSQSTRDILKWTGCEAKTCDDMEDIDEEY
jgi:hypothetical protein